MTTQERGEGLVSNILAIAGFIILIAIIIWGAFHFLRLASAGFSSLLSRAGASAISITAPHSVASGENLDISWKYTVTDDSGSFAVLYQCRQGFQLRIPLATSTAAVPCGTPFTVGDKNASTARFIPILASGDAQIDIPLSVMFMTTGTTTGSIEKKAQGNATVTVTTSVSSQNNSGNTTSTGNGTQTKTQTTTGTTMTTTGTTGTTVVKPVQKTVGPADLVVRILSVGVIDPATGAFIARAPISSNEAVAVRFDIKNQGGMATGPWYFSASLPTSPVTPYVSPQQASLNPGDHIENTLRFNQVFQGGTFTVSADPSNAIRESNEMNNGASQYIQGTNSTYYNYNNYNQGYYQQYYQY